MGVFDTITDASNDLISALLGTGALTTTITYHLFAGDAFNASLGYGEATYNDYASITAARSVHDEKSAAILGSDVSAGDRLFLIAYTSVPAGSISLRDMITEADGTKGQVVHFEEILDQGIVFTVGQN